MYYVGEFFPHMCWALFPIRKVLDENCSGGISAKKWIKGRLKPRVTRTLLAVTCYRDGEDEKCVISGGSEKSSDEGETHTFISGTRRQRRIKIKTRENTHASIRIGYRERFKSDSKSAARYPKIANTVVSIYRTDSAGGELVQRTKREKEMRRRKRRGAQNTAMAIRKKERMETSPGMKRGQSDGGGNGGRKESRRGDWAWL